MLIWRRNVQWRTYNQVMHNSMHQEFSTTHKACPDSYSNVHCKQSRRLQDYKPRHFSFSFGFYCKDKSFKSLKGLTYNVIIYDQTNDTSCTTMPADVPYCSKYYSQVSFPNLIDHDKKEDAAKLFHTLFFISIYSGWWLLLLSVLFGGCVATRFSRDA